MKIEQKILGLFSLAYLSGCAPLLPNVKPIHSSHIKSYNPPDLDLTLIHKEIPKRNVDYLSRAELTFSTNKTQQTHALLTRPINEKLATQIRSIPLGTTMKESEWDKVLLNQKKYPDGQILHIGNWQRFY